MKSERFFYLVQNSARMFFLLAAAVFLFEEGFSAQIVIFAFWLILATAPAIVVTTLIRWGRKWPAKVDWLTLGFASLSLAGFVYSLWMLVNIYGDDNSILMMKIVLPALVAVASGVSAIVAILYCRDRICKIRKFIK